MHVSQGSLMWRASGASHADVLHKSIALHDDTSQSAATSPMSSGGTPQAKFDRTTEAQGSADVGASFEGATWSNWTTFGKRSAFFRTSLGKSQGTSELPARAGARSRLAQKATRRLSNSRRRTTGLDTLSPRSSQAIAQESRNSCQVAVSTPERSSRTSGIGDGRTRRDHVVTATRHSLPSSSLRALSEGHRYCIVQ